MVFEGARLWLSWHYLATLEHNSCIAKYEVYGACNVTVTVELAVGMGIEGILEAIK